MLLHEPCFFDIADPFAALEADLGRLFGARRRGPAPAGLARGPGAPSPALDAWVDDDGLTLQLLVPGVAADGLEITVEADALTVRGTAAAAALPEGSQALRRERPTGSFARTVALPFPVEQEAVEARLVDGVLHLRLPRAAASRPRKVAVRGA